MQLELSLYRRGTLAEAIAWSLLNTTDHLQPPTLIDYRDRGRWLLEKIAADLRVREHEIELSAITYEMLLRLHKAWGPASGREDGFKTVTIKKRYILLHRVMTHAAARGLIDKLPHFPELRSDGSARQKVHTQAQFEATRAQLVEPWATWATVCWYTAMHTFDCNRARERWFRPDDPFRSSSGDIVAPGRWQRFNHKNYPNDEDTVWMPMEPAFAEWMLARQRRGEPADKVTGPWHRCVKTIAAACHKADVPVVAPIDWRRSRASIWCAEGKSDEWIRIALGHKGYGFAGPARAAAGMDSPPRPTRPTMRSVHYYRGTVDMMASG